MQSASQPYKCNICGIVLINSKELSKHQKAVHTDKMFQCQSCNKLFDNKKEFKNHAADVHSNSRVAAPSDYINKKSIKRVSIEETDDDAEIESMLLQRANEDEKARKRTRGPYRKASSSSVTKP
jgi:uncharacterized C2H2 Zn-finger protein